MTVAVVLVPSPQKTVAVLVLEGSKSENVACIVSALPLIAGEAGRGHGRHNIVDGDSQAIGGVRAILVGGVRADGVALSAGGENVRDGRGIAGNVLRSTSITPVDGPGADGFGADSVAVARVCRWNASLTGYSVPLMVSVGAT